MRSSRAALFNPTTMTASGDGKSQRGRLHHFFEIPHFYPWILRAEMMMINHPDRGHCAAKLRPGNWCARGANFFAPRRNGMFPQHGPVPLNFAIWAYCLVWILVGLYTFLTAARWYHRFVRGKAFDKMVDCYSYVNVAFRAGLAFQKKLKARERYELDPYLRAVHTLVNWFHDNRFFFNGKQDQLGELVNAAAKETKVFVPSGGDMTRLLELRAELERRLGEPFQEVFPARAHALAWVHEFALTPLPATPADSSPRSTAKFARPPKAHGGLAPNLETSGWRRRATGRRPFATGRSWRESRQPWEPWSRDRARPGLFRAGPEGSRRRCPVS